MIARIWQGRTSRDYFEAYSSFLKAKAVPDYRSTPGFKKLIFLRNITGDEAHFTLITFWENITAVQTFAGDDIEKAKYYPEDEGFLLTFEEKVVHYEVFF